MKNFWFKLLIFLAPLLLLVPLPCYVLFVSSESFYDVDKDIENNEKYLIGYAYNEKNYDYVKWKALNSGRRYKVVSLGSSRVLQFRDEMFDSSFYNAGYAMNGVNDFLPFLKSMPEEMLPEYLIVGLDHWMFNERWDNLKSNPLPGDWKNGFRSNPDAQILKNVWKDLFEEKYTVRLPHHADSIKRIGLNAIVNNKGFRNDGSMQYGEQIEKLLSNDTTALDFQFLDTQDRIRRGSDRFQYAKEMNTGTEAILDEFLNFCRSKKIKVIAFLPPFADKVYNQMVSSGSYPYMTQIYSRLNPMFKKYSYEWYDFSALSLVGSNDEEALDGFHGGELSYLRILIKMLESGSVLNKVCIAEKLKSERENPVNRYSVYRY